MVVHAGAKASHLRSSPESVVHSVGNARAHTPTYTHDPGVARARKRTRSRVGREFRARVLWFFAAAHWHTRTHITGTHSPRRGRSSLHRSVLCRLAEALLGALCTAKGASLAAGIYTHCPQTYPACRASTHLPTPMTGSRQALRVLMTGVGLLLGPGFLVSHAPHVLLSPALLAWVALFGHKWSHAPRSYASTLRVFDNVSASPRFFRYAGTPSSAGWVLLITPRILSQTGRGLLWGALKCGIPATPLSGRLPRFCERAAMCRSCLPSSAAPYATPSWSQGALGRTIAERHVERSVAARRGREFPR